MIHFFVSFKDMYFHYLIPDQLHNHVRIFGGNVLLLYHLLDNLQFLDLCQSSQFQGVFPF